MLWKTNFGHTRYTRSLLLTIATMVFWQASSAFAGSPQSLSAPDLEIAVLQGEDGVNIIKKKTAVKPVVEVRRKNALPGVGPVGAGVTVTFTVEGRGVAKFANGQRSMSVVTDSNGRAVAGQLRPLKQGPLNIKVEATYRGQTVTRTIAQSNFKTAAAASKLGKIPLSSHGDVGAQAATGTSSGAAGGSSAATGATALAGAAGHGLMIAGIAGSVAAAGGAVAYTELKKTIANATCDSTTLLNQFNQDLSVAESCVNNSLDPETQCKTQAQALLNDLGQYCSACGGVPAEVSSYTSWAQQEAQQIGLTYPSSCE